MEGRKERKPFTVIEAISGDKARVAGHVKWFDATKGYGFITTDGENPKDYFVHKIQLYTEDHFPRHPVLFNKEPVEFVIGESEQGPVAEEVSLPEGKIIPGFRRRFYRRRPQQKTDAKPTEGAEVKVEGSEEKPRKQFRRRIIRRTNRRPAMKAENPAEEKPADAPAAPEAPEAPADAKPKRNSNRKRNGRKNDKPAEEKPKAAPEAPAAPAVPAAPAEEKPAEEPAKL